MTSDEADAYNWLEKRFWKNICSARNYFLWCPKYNAETGKLMWLCKAVKVESGWVDHVGSGAEYEIIQTRWYKPRDFLIKRLSN